MVYFNFEGCSVFFISERERLKPIINTVFVICFCFTTYIFLTLERNYYWFHLVFHSIGYILKHSFSNNDVLQLLTSKVTLTKFAEHLWQNNNATTLHPTPTQTPIFAPSMDTELRYWTRRLSFRIEEIDKVVQENITFSVSDKYYSVFSTYLSLHFTCENLSIWNRNTRWNSFIQQPWKLSISAPQKLMIYFLT